MIDILIYRDEFSMSVVAMPCCHPEEGVFLMIVVRHVYQAKYGKGDELVALLKEMDKHMEKVTGAKVASRLLTDASGPFFTVVQEIQVVNLAEWETTNGKLFQSAEFQSWFPRWLDLVESGRREFYNLV
jgi:hypothetical protein